MTVNAHIGEIDGLKTVWVERDERPFDVTLMFRVGVFDEPLRMRGVTHLVEHLAFYALRSISTPSDGHVGDQETVFRARGGFEECGEFVSAICEALVNLPIGRLEREISVLEVEGQERRLDGRMWALREFFGPSGPGAVSYTELGLRWLDGDAVEAWRRHYFTRQNSVLVVSAPQPPQWRLALSEGEHFPYRAPKRLLVPEQPLLRREDGAGVSWASVVDFPRGHPSPHLTPAYDTFIRRVESQLRHQLGMVYSISPMYTRLDDQQVLLGLGAPCDAGSSQQVALAVVDLANDFADGGPSVAELGSFLREEERRLLDDPAGADAHHIEGIAESLLKGWALPTTQQEKLASWRDLNPEEVREAWTDLYRRSVYLGDLPSGLMPELGPKYFARPMEEGVRYDVRRDYRGSTADEIVIGPKGLSIRFVPGWVHFPTQVIHLVAADEVLVGVASDELTYAFHPASYRARWSRGVASSEAGLVIAVAAALIFGFILVLSPYLALFTILPLIAVGNLIWNLFRKAIRLDDRRLTLQAAISRYIPEDLRLPPHRMKAAQRQSTETTVTGSAIPLSNAGRGSETG